MGGPVEPAGSRPEHRRRRRAASRPAGPPAATSSAATSSAAGPAPAEQPPATEPAAPSRKPRAKKPAGGHDAQGGPAAKRGRNTERGERAKNTERGARGRRSPSDGALRDLAGAGPSKLGVDGALRARDVNRPTDDDLAEAEREVVVVRRNWKPPTDT